MANGASRTGLIVDANVKDFFRGLVDTVVCEQNVNARDDTVHYIVNLLSNFAYSDCLFEHTSEGRTIKPLALTYAEALQASSVHERNHALRRLGDVALFMAGMFSHSLRRKVVNIEYYISMGGNAYGYLSDATRSTAQWHTFSEVFAELAEHFAEFVDVLGEVSEEAKLGSDSDVLRLYELWVRTGSRRAERHLRRMGIALAPAGSASRQH